MSALTRFFIALGASVTSALEKFAAEMTEAAKTLPDREYWRGYEDGMTDGRAAGWAVFEQATGVTYTVEPDTATNARAEAELAGPGHVAVPVWVAQHMSNSYAHGRHRVARALGGGDKNDA